MKMEKIYCLENYIANGPTKSIELYEREKILLRGASGCGKSLSLQKIANINHIPQLPIRSKCYKNFSVSYSAQRYWALGKNIIEEITFFAKKGKINKEAITNASYASFITEEKSYKELVNHEWNKIGTYNLSGGQLKRLSVARSLYNNSEVILLDEPTASVQKTMKAEIIKRILSVYSKSTILVVSHDDIDEELFDKVVKW